MSKKLSGYITALALLALSAISNLPQQAKAQQVGRLTVGGLEREMLIHTPTGAPQGAMLPTVILLHGGGGSPEGVKLITHMDKIADQARFLLIMPRSHGALWNDGRFQSSVDDVAYFAEMIHAMTQAGIADPRRIYVIGMSNGGTMALRLACQLGDRIAGVGIVAANMPYNLATRCRPSHPMPMMMINGTDDPFMPFNGGDLKVGGQNRGKFLSAQQTADWWRQVGRCAGSAASDRLPDYNPIDGVTGSRYVWNSCIGGGEVHLYALAGGGHTWPGGVQYAGKEKIGRVSTDFDAGIVLWNFLLRFTR